MPGTGWMSLLLIGVYGLVAAAMVFATLATFPVLLLLIPRRP